LWGLPQRSEHDPVCSPEAPAACDFNRQDWAALLKLKSQAELATLGPVAPARMLPAPPVQQTCCVNCVLGSVIPRCSAQDSPSSPIDPAAVD
jgi:hypothetical protein